MQKPEEVRLFVGGLTSIGFMQSSLLYQEGVDWILLLLCVDLIDKDIKQITQIFHKHQTVRINDLL